MPAEGAFDSGYTLHDGTNIAEKGTRFAPVCQRDQSASAAFIAPAKFISRLAVPSPTMALLVGTAECEVAGRICSTTAQVRFGCAP